MGKSMSNHDRSFHQGAPSVPATEGFEALCRGLSASGRDYLRRIGGAINELAPKPGAIVYVSARKLPFRLNGLEPTIFSAIDANTHLQVAQAYHSLTIASAVSFIEFVAQSFPFAIAQVRTPAEKPFSVPAGERPHRDFSTILGERGFVHTLIVDPRHDALSAITSKLSFVTLTSGLSTRPTSNELQLQLDRFLFYHNNSRQVPWLDGKTPIQKLKTFEGFSRLRTFTPTGVSQVKGGPRQVVEQTQILAKESGVIGSNHTKSMNQNGSVV